MLDQNSLIDVASVAELMFIGAFIAIFVTAFAGLSWLVMRLRARIDSLRLQVAQQWNDLLELQRSISSAVEAEPDRGRQQHLEERLDRLAKQQEQLLLRDASTAPYLQAIRHAERGGTVEELVAVYDLGRAEAELILSLHGPK